MGKKSSKISTNNSVDICYLRVRKVGYVHNYADSSCGHRLSPFGHQFLMSRPEYCIYLLSIEKKEPFLLWHPEKYRETRHP